MPITAILKISNPSFIMADNPQMQEQPQQPKHMIIDIMPLLQPAGIIFGLIGLYLSLVNGVEIFQAFFRAVLVYAGFIILGMIFQYIFIQMVNKVKIREAQRLIEEEIRLEEEARLAAEEKEKQRTENGL